MGNKICHITDICGDTLKQSQLQSLSNGDNNQSLLLGNPVLDQGKVKIGDLVGNEIEEQFLPNTKYIDSYNAYNNFYFIINRVKFLQKKIKKFLQNKRQKEKNFDEKSISKKNSKEHSNGITNEKKNDTPKKKPLDSSVQRALKNYANFQDEVLYDENELGVPNGEGDYKKQQTSMSFYSLSVSMRSEGLLNGNEIKGYFLKKNKRYKYKGGFLNKKKHGFGRVTWEDRSVLYANFTNSRINGICKYIDAKGTTFQGTYVNNRPFGYGIFLRGKIVIFEGEWVNNNLNGYGIESWKDGTFYQGEYDQSIKKGVGLYRWPDGTIYQGEWENDQMNGWGTIMYNDERTFHGQISDGLMHGFGEFFWPDGKIYIGDYSCGKRNGFGFFVWEKDPLSVYVGFWDRGKMNGLGIKINEDKVKYGIWREGKKDTWLQGRWLAKNHLKGAQAKYIKFFELPESNLIKFVTRFINMEDE